MELFLICWHSSVKWKKKELTEDEASRKIGQQLFDRYVKPVIGDDVPPEQRTAGPVPPPPSIKSYAEYYKEKNGGGMA